MKHLSDIQIAQQKELVHIKNIASKLGVEEDDLEMSVEEEQEAMEELNLIRQDIKKKLLH